jgi:hypothetical protein
MRGLLVSEEHPTSVFRIDIFYSENGDRRLFQTVGIYLSKFSALHSRCHCLERFNPTLKRVALVLIICYKINILFSELQRNVRLRRYLEWRCCAKKFLFETVVLDL